MHLILISYLTFYGRHKPTIGFATQNKNLTAEKFNAFLQRNSASNFDVHPFYRTKLTLKAPNSQNGHTQTIRR